MLDLILLRCWSIVMLPIRIELENFVSHVHSVLDFDFSSALIVGMHDGDDRFSNGAGKTSLLSAIAWALFGESHHKNADDVVRRGTSMCRVEFIFAHDNSKYKVIRTRNVRYSRTEVQFEKIDGDKIINLSRDTNKLTENEIKNIIKSSYDVFTNSSYFRQGMGFDFAEGTFSSRQSLIGSLLNLDKWNRYQKFAKDEADKAALLYDKLSLEKDRLATVKNKLENISVSLENKITNLNKLEANHSSLEEEISLLNKKVADSDKLNELSKYEDLKSKLQYSKTSLNEAIQGYNRKELELDKLDESILSYNKSVDNLSAKVDNLQSVINADQKLEISSLEDKILEGRSKLLHISNQLKNLENEECSLCGHIWGNEEAKSHELRHKHDKKVALEAQLKKAEVRLAEIKDRDNAVRQAQAQCFSLNAQISLYKEHVSELTIKKKIVHDDILAAKSKVDRCKDQVERLQNSIESLSIISKADTVKEAVELLRTKQEQLDLTRKSISQFNFDVGALTQEIKILNEQLINEKAIIRQHEESGRNLAIYSKLAKIFSRDGVQAIIIDNIIEDLTKTVNYWLAEFCADQTYIRFITQKKNTKGDWRETLELEVITSTGISKFESLSGGERFRVSFAIRLALSILQAKRMGGEVQLLLLDEVSTSLDASGLETFVSIIKKLEKSMKIMLITHDDRLKDEFETIIKIKKTAEGSFLERQ